MNIKKERLKKNKKTTSCLFALGLCFTFIQGTEAQHNSSLQSESPENKIKYAFTGNRPSIIIRPGWDNSQRMLRMQHSDEKDFVRYDEYFNRAVKRGSTILVTGDKPRFALMYTDKSDKVDPDLIKMGDGRIRILFGDKEYWLDLLPGIKTIFNPSSTEYICSLPTNPQLTIRLLISQASDWGAITRLSFNNNSRSAIQIKAGLVYGGLRKCGRTFSASYFSLNDKEDLSSNRVDPADSLAKISDPNIKGSVYIRSQPLINPVLQDSLIEFSHTLNIRPNGKEQVYFITGLSLQQNNSRIYNRISGEDPETVIQESRKYYQGILSKYPISTPVSLLDRGYQTALLNFDNVYADPGWLEGIHWWSSYFTNNFQISAAIALRQNDRAGKDLLFYNSSEYGPAPVMTAAGKADIQSKNGEDGLPYFIYNLIQYYNSTGDRSVVLKVWPKLRSSIDQLWERRDGDGNGLLNWHLGANAFLYQADHLELPGDAASPSLMMAGMLDKLSVIALQLGQSADAERWQSLASKMYRNLESTLWDRKAGAFYSHKDEQSLFHSAHYYSDLVFPSLYTNLPGDYGWQSLGYLYRTLWLNNYKGERNLMRVGDYKPSIFGNDNVMPVQMAEAARAYFEQGENEKGVSLLKSIALAGTIFTEAPGNFPERMNDEGKGEANYLFGNPIGAFIYAMINGLFGLAVVDQGNTLQWSPSFPDKWNHVALQVPYAKVSFKKSGEGIHIKRLYDCLQDEPRKIDFSLYLEPAKEIKISCNGEKIIFTASPALNKTHIHFHVNRALHQVILIQYTIVPAGFSGSDSAHAGERLHWEINGGIKKIIDPQNTLQETAISGNLLTGFATHDTGWHTVFIEAMQVPVVYALDFYNQPVVVGKGDSVVHWDELKNEPFLPLDISSYYNTGRIFLSSRWRYEYASIDSSYFSSVAVSSRKIFEQFGYSPKGNLTVAMIDNGISDPFTAHTKANGMPNLLEIPLNRRLQGLSFLWLNETQSRNTGLEVGNIQLNYSDGEIKKIPLIVGKNIDASWKYFATDLKPVFLNGEDYAKIYSVPCNPGKELKSFTIILKASDVQIGLMAVNMILPSKQHLPLVGAIRWDGWFYDPANFVTKIVQKTLAPKEFHERLPFFAKEISSDSVYINGSSQGVMDREITYAKTGGLDYWAFVLYSPGEELSIGMDNYLKSSHRREINFSIITEQARVVPANTAYLNYIVRLLQEPGYQQVENGRPLWFLGFVDSASVIKNWGSFRGMKKKLDSIRNIVMKTGLKNPYLVIMDFDASLGKRWSDSLGGDAISSYATSKNSIKAPYKKLDEEAADFWNDCKVTGSQVVPIFMAGWSPKPRTDYPNEWSHFYPKDAYYANATASELADHVRKGLIWLQNNQSSARSQCALIYAWNEYDEGGWLGPTLCCGTERLDALSAAIKEFKKLK